MANEKKISGLAGLKSSRKAQLRYDNNYFECRKIDDALAEITFVSDYVSVHPACLPRSPVDVPKAVVHDNHEVLTAKKDLTRIRSLPAPIASSSVVGTGDERELIFGNHIERRLNDYEKARLEIVQKAFDKKRSEFSEVSKILCTQSSKNLNALKSKRMFLERLKEEKLVAKQQAMSVESNLKHQKLKNDHSERAVKSNQKLKEASLLDSQERETKSRQLLEFQEQVSAFVEQKQYVYAAYQDVAAAVKTCQAPEQLSEEVQVAVADINQILAHVHDLVQGICDGHMAEGAVEMVARYRDQAEACSTVIKAGVDAVNEANRTEQFEQQQPPTLAGGNSEIPRVGQLPPSPVVQSSLPQSAAAPRMSSVFGEPLKIYLTYVENVEKVQAACQDVATNANMKKYRLELQKAINTPINAISTHSGSHLRDKVDRLLRMLSGQPIDASARMSLKDHPQGRLFCLDLLAKKFVRQGEEQVSAKHEAAFPIASVILEIWLQYPEFGQLLLGHFYLKFSYLVPYLVQREGKTESEYLTALGFNVVDGTLETKDMFLKRVTGLVRLYSAIMQMPVPPRSNLVHPLGLGACWTWISYCLRLAPVPDVTATVLFNVLEVCGHSLIKQYGRQFHKVMVNLCREYLPDVQRSGGSGGPVTRLESLLQTYAKTGRIQPPSGTLPDNFWHT